MRPVTLLISDPCPASWAAMTPASGGRHCAACVKTVVDFTSKTDAEILTYFRQAGAERTCGRFRAGQLGQPLQLAAAPNRWRTWLGALLAASSLGQLPAPRAMAQTALRGTAGPLPIAAAATQEPTAPPTSPVAESAATLRPHGSRTLRGKVYDASNQLPLPGTTVLLKNTSLGVSTDADGSFALAIPGEEPVVQLAVIFIGYNAVEQSVTLADNAPLTVLLKPSEQMLSGEVVIIPAQRPWHPRRLYYWTKSKLTSAFGR